MQRQKEDKKRIILGITGNFGSGKTTVSKMLAKGGLSIIDADEIAHAVIKQGNIAYKRIVASFGKDILDKDGQINRKKLAGLVFDNKELLQKLNKIVHPRVIAIIRKQINNAKLKNVILDAPLLIEAGLKGTVDKIIAVKIDRKVQIERIKKRTAFSQADILKIIKSQIPQNELLRLADFIIDNSGTIVETRKQVTRVFQELFGKKEKPDESKNTRP